MNIPGIPGWVLVLVGGVGLVGVAAFLHALASFIRQRAAATPDKADDAKAELVAKPLDEIADRISLIKPPGK